jgi:Protein of unknown function (DUF3040)
MLSQDDQRRLDEIARQISLEDRWFADAMRDGTPCPPSGDRRWPMLVAALVGFVIVLIGLVSTSPITAVLGGGVIGGAAYGYQRQLRRAHGGQRI